MASQRSPVHASTDSAAGENAPARAARATGVAVAAPYLVLTVLAAITRFWHLDRPRAVVFDELYYLQFTGDYLAHRFFFDVHPPLGRLMFAAQAGLLHLSAADLLRPSPEPALRILPAVAGTLLVPLMFLVMRQVGASRMTAGLAAGATLLDNALLVYSRVVLPDVFIVFLGLSGISAYLAARRRAGGQRVGFLALSGLLCGCALSVKWTGASAIGLTLAVWAFDTWPPRGEIRRVAGDMTILIGLPVAVYLAAFAVHFALLTHSGPGDTFMSARFQSTLIGAPRYDPNAAPLSFWAKLAETHHAIRYGNGGLQNVTHPASSAWYTWPIMKHPIALWGSPDSQNGVHTMMILLGNPVVWWWAMLLAILLLVRVAVRRGEELRQFPTAFLIGGFLINFLPFAAIARVMYLYHYLFALVFLIGAGAWSLERFVSARRARIVYGGAIALILVGFVYFLPFTYGWPMSDASWDMHFRVLHPF